MTNSEQHFSEQTRTDLRRQQVIDAATECFRRSGFHGASMAEISKAACMSVGHIYHYFENKEALIAAIVGRNLLRALDIADRLQPESARGLLRHAATAQVEEMVNERLNSENAGLDLEILAEASRNPKVAEAIQAADRTTHQRFAAVVEIDRRARSAGPDPFRDARMDILCALFEGLTIRAIENPRIEREYLITLMQDTVGFLLEHQPEMPRAGASTDA